MHLQLKPCTLHTKLTHLYNDVSVNFSIQQHFLFNLTKNRLFCFAHTSRYNKDSEKQVGKFTFTGNYVRKPRCKALSHIQDKCSRIRSVQANFVLIHRHSRCLRQQETDLTDQRCRLCGSENLHRHTDNGYKTGYNV